jgi:sec-independent protein translocase protein TatC
MARDREKQMSFLEHLEELRWTVIWIAVVTVAATAGGWYFADRTLAVISSDLSHILARTYGSGTEYKLHVFEVSEAFTVKFKVALLLGLLAALPFNIYKVWQFVSPGLFSREKRTLAPLVLLSIALFYAGVAFAYLVMVKITVAFLFRMTPPSVAATVRLGSYVTFVTKFCMTFGLVFQVPLVLAMLAWVGLVSASTLRHWWRYAVVGILALAAVLTPPDVISQMMMAVPMLLLYWVGYLLARAFERRGKRRVSP